MFCRNYLQFKLFNRQFCSVLPFCSALPIQYTGPARTFFAARVSDKLRWVRAGLRQSPRGSGRARVVEI